MARLRTSSLLVPGARLLCLVLISSALFFMAAMSACFFFLLFILFLFLEGQGIRSLSRESAYLLVLAVFIIATQCINFRDGLRFEKFALMDALAFSARLAASYMAGRLFYKTTPSSELRTVAIEASCLFPARIRMWISLSFLLILGSIPMILGDWKEARIAATARGLTSKMKIGSYISLFAAFLSRLMLDAAKLPEVLASRGWSGTNSISRHQTTKWRLIDWLVVIVSLSILAIAVLA